MSGNVTMDSVVTMLKEGLLAQDVTSSTAVRLIDLAGLDKVDSSAVSMMLAWLRDAQRQERAISFINVPENLLSLARLYGVSEMLDLS